MIYEGILKGAPARGACTLSTGINKSVDDEAFILGDNREKYLEGIPIWTGYLAVWRDKRVRARFLPQHDYETGAQIVLMWPCTPKPAHPYFELYYNERLVMYPISICGHNAIDVNGEVFNFSRLLNENEIMLPEEYFYRPALGEFAPAPGKSRVDFINKEKPYYDRFGRLFMRTIHALRVEWPDSPALRPGNDAKPILEKLANFFRRKVQQVHAAPRVPRKPEEYRDFNFFKESCATIIGDGLRQTGFSGIRGILPRDMFVNAAHHFLQEQKKGSFRVMLYKIPQLKVAEAPYSKPTPVLNPCNRLRRV
jgi:hypothetical protein